MALITCKECGGKMSDRTEACPHCGCPIEFQNVNFLQVKHPQNSNNSPVNGNKVQSNKTIKVLAISLGTIIGVIILLLCGNFVLYNFFGIGSARLCGEVSAKESVENAQMTDEAIPTDVISAVDQEKEAERARLEEEQRIQEERARQEEERRQKEQTEWIYGTWECKGTIDYGEYLGGVQRFTAKAIISRNNLKVYLDGELCYNGSYEIEDGEIKYNRTNSYCDVMPLDYSRKQIEFGDGMYYSRVSSDSNYSNSNYSSSNSNTYSRSFSSPNDVLSYTSSNSFYNGGHKLQIKYDAVYLNGTALTGAPRVSTFSGSNATIIASSPYSGGSNMYFYVNCANGTITQKGDIFRIR